MREWIDIKPGEAKEVGKDGRRLRLFRDPKKRDRLLVEWPDLVELFTDEHEKKLPEAEGNR